MRDAQVCVTCIPRDQPLSQFFDALEQLVHQPTGKQAIGLKQPAEFPV